MNSTYYYYSYSYEHGLSSVTEIRHARDPKTLSVVEWIVSGEEFVFPAVTAVYPGRVVLGLPELHLFQESYSREDDHALRQGNR